MDYQRVTAVAVPAGSAVTGIYPSLNLADAFAVPLPLSASTDPEVLARFIFAHQPAWISRLMRVRDAVVAGFGLKTATHLATLAQGAPASRLGIFKVYSKNDREIIVGEDDRHLNFRLSILCADDPLTQGGRRLTLSTVVHCHNLLGRIYILVIGPMHRLVVKASLRRAARLGWP